MRAVGTPRGAGWLRTFAIAAKELRQMSRDRLTLGMIVGLPMLQMMLFGYAINYDVRHVAAGVVDLAHTTGSRALVADLAASQVLDFNAHPAGVEQMRAQIVSGKIHAGLYIPPDFERRRIDGTRPVAQLILDATRPGVDTAVRALAAAPLPSRNGLAVRPAFGIEVLSEFNPERRTAVQVVPTLIGVILTMTMVIFTSIALVRERERGNLELLIMTPVRSRELMLGKLLPYVGVGLIQTTLVLLVAVGVFDVPINGSLLSLYLGAGLFIASTLSLGLVVSTIATTQFQAMQLGIFTMLPSILLSGFAFPFEGMPVLVQYLAQAIPLTHFVEILRGVILRGADLRDLWWPCTKLGIFLSLALLVAALRFRKRLD
jgi:ABC-2 type transport system permease protein